MLIFATSKPNWGMKQQPLQKKGCLIYARCKEKQCGNRVR